MGPGGPGMDPRNVNYGGMEPGGMRPGIGPNGRDMGPVGLGPGHGMGLGGPNNMVGHGMSGMGMGPGMMMMGPQMMGPGLGMMGGPMMGPDGMSPNRPMMGGSMGHGDPMGPNGPSNGMNGSMSGSDGGPMMMGPNGQMGPPCSMSGPMHSPMPQSNTSGMTISQGPGSNSSHGSAHGNGPVGTPIGNLSGGTPSTGEPPNLSGPGSVGGPNGPKSVGPPMGSIGMGMNVPMGTSSYPNMMGPVQSPLSVMSNEKVYPPGQPMFFNSQNPSAPPIYPCSVCHKEVNDNDQAILCESGCHFWFHRICTGLAETAFLFLTKEIYAEWVCDKCFTSKDVPLVKFKA